MTYTRPVLLTNSNIISTCDTHQF